jgi:hypothetical protein
MAGSGREWRSDGQPTTGATDREITMAHLPKSAALLVFLATSLAPIAPVHAGTATTMAVDNCNGALPGFEGALRKRALAIANEGTTNAFVSCAATTNEAQSAGNSQIAVFATNRAETPQILSCTFVDGFGPEIVALSPKGIPLAVYRSKVVAIAPGTATALSWTATEFAVTTFSEYASVSCNLTPGMELNVMGAVWVDND